MYKHPRGLQVWAFLCHAYERAGAVFLYGVDKRFWKSEVFEERNLRPLSIKTAWIDSRRRSSQPSWNMAAFNYAASREDASWQVKCHLFAKRFMFTGCLRWLTFSSLQNIFLLLCQKQWKHRALDEGTDFVMGWSPLCLKSAIREHHMTVFLWNLVGWSCHPWIRVELIQNWFRRPSHCGSNRGACELKNRSMKRIVALITVETPDARLLLLLFFNIHTLIFSFFSEHSLWKQLHFFFGMTSVTFDVKSTM